MECPSCGKKLKDDEIVCPACDYSFEEDDSLDSDEEYEEIDIDDFKDPTYDENVELLDDVEEPIYEEVSFEEEKEEDDSYLELFIGEDYRWIAKRWLNPYAFLLSWMYFLYRKLYLIGIIGLVITGIVVRLYPSYLLYYILIVMFSSGILFNFIYMRIAKRRVNRLKRIYEGSDLEAACQIKGGVNTPRALLIFFIFLVIMFCTYLHIHPGESKPNYWKENNENMANCILMSKKAHALIDKNIKLGTLEESLCHVTITNTKNYDIYLKIMDDNDNEVYYYFKNDGKYLTVEGDTSKISSWEKKKIDGSILKEEEQMLEVSKQIEDKMKEMIQLSKQEEELIQNRKNTSERVNYYLKKDDIYR